MFVFLAGDKRRKKQDFSDVSITGLANTSGFVVLEIDCGLLRLKAVQCLLRFQSSARGSDLVRRSGHLLEMSNMNIS